MIAFSAECAICYFCFAVVNKDVWAVGDEVVVDEAGVAGGFVATFTDGFDFGDVFGDLEEAGGAGEATILLAEVETEAVGYDGDV